MATAVLALLQRSSFCQHCENLTVSFQIPGDATLVFEIELFDFHGEDISKVFISLNLHDTSGSLDSFCTWFIKIIT